MDEVVSQTPQDIVQKGSDEALTSQTFVKDATPAPVITNDLKEFVKPSEASVPHLPEVGLQAAADSTPVKTEKELPYTEKEIDEKLKAGGNLRLSAHEIQEGEYTEPSNLFLLTLVKAVYRKFKVFGKLTGNRT